MRKCPVKTYEEAFFPAKPDPAFRPISIVCAQNIIDQIARLERESFVYATFPKDVTGRYLHLIEPETFGRDDCQTSQTVIVHIDKIASCPNDKWHCRYFISRLDTKTERLVQSFMRRAA
jgi:hypothetical protein